MNSASTHFVPTSRVGIYEPLHQFGMWGETFKNNIGNGGSMNTPNHILIPNNQKLDNTNLSEDTSHGTPHMFDQEASTSRHPDKIQRRLAQNREAARKSRLRKKAYVQQLETSRLKLIQLEQELDRARQQGFYVGNGIDTSSLGFSETMNPGLLRLRWNMDTGLKNRTNRYANLERFYTDMLPTSSYVRKLKTP